MAVSQLSHFIKIYIDILFTLGRPCTSDISRRDYRVAQMKHTVVYESARNGDYLTVAIKKSQRDPFSGRHDCHLTTACTNEKHINKWVRVHGRLTPHYLCVKSTPSKPISLL
jgi:hypothetical protein